MGEIGGRKNGKSLKAERKGRKGCNYILIKIFKLLRKKTDQNDFSRENNKSKEKCICVQILG